MDIGEILKNIWNSSGYHLFGEAGGWQNIVMIIVALVFLYLGIKKQFEPLLLVGIAFGMLLTNLPALDGDKIFTPNGGREPRLLKKEWIISTFCKRAACSICFTSASRLVFILA